MLFLSLSQSVMDSSVAVSSPLSTSFSSSVLPSTPRSAIRPLSAAYRSSGSDYQVTFDPRIHFVSTLKSETCILLTVEINLCVCLQVVADRQTPRKDDSFVSKAMEYMFGW